MMRRRRGQAGILGAVLIAFMIILSIATYMFMAGESDKYLNTINRSLDRREARIDEDLNPLGYPDQKVLEITNVGDITSHVVGFVVLNNNTGEMEFYSYDLELSPMEKVEVSFKEMKPYPPYITGVITELGNLFWDEVITQGGGAGGMGAAPSGNQTYSISNASWVFNRFSLYLWQRTVGGGRTSYSQDALYGYSLDYSGYNDVENYGYYGTITEAEQWIGYGRYTDGNGIPICGLYIVVPYRLEPNKQYNIDVSVGIRVKAYAYLTNMRHQWYADTQTRTLDTYIYTELGGMRVDLAVVNTTRTYDSWFAYNNYRPFGTTYSRNYLMNITISIAFNSSVYSDEIIIFIPIEVMFHADARGYSSSSRVKFVIDYYRLLLESLSIDIRES
jgi:hypothetical protein